MENPCFKEKVLVYFHTFELTLLESRGIYNFRISFKNNRHKYIGTHYRFLRLFLWVPSKSIVLVLLSLYPLTKIWWYQILRIDYHFIQKFVSILRIDLFRGWGLRCLDDIPAGGFICIYAGQLLTEQGANTVSTVWLS